MKRHLFLFAFILPQWVYSFEPKNSFIELAKKVRSSVVNISISRSEINNFIQLYPGYFMPVPQVKASGSGFIIDKKGFIVTNAHVVQNFDKIQVQFDGDDQFYPAKLLGLDTLSDIALLKVSVNKELRAFQFGNSEKLQVGEWVAAIGNPHGFGTYNDKGNYFCSKKRN